jgi:hypothetical protein
VASLTGKNALRLTGAAVAGQRPTLRGAVSVPSTSNSAMVGILAACLSLLLCLGEGAREGAGWVRRGLGADVRPGVSSVLRAGTEPSGTSGVGASRSESERVGSCGVQSARLKGVATCRGARKGRPHLPAPHTRCATTTNNDFCTLCATQVQPICTLHIRYPRQTTTCSTPTDACHKTQHLSVRLRHTCTHMCGSPRWRTCCPIQPLQLQCRRRDARLASLLRNTRTAAPVSQARLPRQRSLCQVLWCSACALKLVLWSSGPLALSSSRR